MGKRGTLNHSGGLILPARRPQRHLAERQLPLRRVHRPQAGPAAAAVAAVAATQLVLRRSQGQRCEQAYAIDAIPQIPIIQYIFCNQISDPILLMTENCF